MNRPAKMYEAGFIQTYYDGPEREECGGSGCGYGYGGSGAGNRDRTGDGSGSDAGTDCCRESWCCYDFGGPHDEYMEYGYGAGQRL